MSNSINITGQVLDAQTNTGVTGVIVEISDKSMRLQRVLATSDTDVHGRFSTVLDMQQLGFDGPLELAFTVLKEGKPFTSTNNSVIWNTQTEDDVTIYIRQQIRADRPIGKDRVNAIQVFRGARFVQQSDFKGVYNQTKGRVSMPFGFITDMLGNAFKNADIAPVRVNPATDTRTLYGQDVAAATTNLQAQQVGVNQVLPYDPTFNSDSFKVLTSAPINVAAGQKVNLYQENGKVKYYTIVQNATVQPPAGQSPTGAPQVNLVTQQQFASLNDQLAVTKQEAVAKDAMIVQLKVQMEVLQKDHQDLKNIITSDSFTRMMKAQNITPVQNPG